jgi:hypothetical protein
MMTQVRQTFLLLLVLATACGRQPEQAQQTKANEPDTSGALELYDVSLSSDNVQIGQQVSFCFKARNAVVVSGFPGKFSKNGSLDGDCLVDTPKQHTLYRLQVTGSDGTTRTQSTFVRVRR